MADFDERKMPQIAVGKTPQGQFVAEAPDVTRPGWQHNVFGHGWGAWLGNPHARYGYLVSAQDIPVAVKLEMLKDEVVALCVAFTGAMLVKARREIQCADLGKQRFFEALFREWEQEFILQANVGIGLGSVGLIKKWAFHVPEPRAVAVPPVWTATATPYVITGFDALYPVGSTPRFDAAGHHFQGLDTPDGPVDGFYSLWLTFRQELAFGGYMGAGRLDHCYKQWWLKNFGQDLYVVALQKQANRVVQASYPPGVDARTGKSNQAIALEVGDSVRGGATVAIPSDTYTTLGLDGEERASTNLKWGLQFLESAGGMDSFHEIDNHHDRKMSLGYFLPPQALLEVTGGQLGSVTSAERLAEIATELLLQDAADIDRHVNKYIFPAISAANFPAASPRVVLRTTGLAADNGALLVEIIKALIGQHPDAAYFDLRAAMAELQFPLKSEAAVKATQQEKSAREAPRAPETAPKTAVSAALDDAGRVQPEGRPLPLWPERAVPVAARDAALAVQWWRDFAPVGMKELLAATPDAALDVADASLDMGGPGSGNWAHLGRPGKVGGSAPRNAGMTIAKGRDWLERYAQVAGKPHPLAVEIAAGKQGTTAQRIQQIKDELATIAQRVSAIEDEKKSFKQQYLEKRLNVLQYQKATAGLNTELMELAELYQGLEEELKKIGDGENPAKSEPEPEPRAPTAAELAQAARAQVMAADEAHAQQVARLQEAMETQLQRQREAIDRLSAIKMRHGLQPSMYLADADYPAAKELFDTVTAAVTTANQAYYVARDAQVAAARETLYVEQPIAITPQYKSSFKGDPRQAAIAQGVQEFSKLVAVAPETNTVIFKKASGGRASFAFWSGVVNTTKGCAVATIVHELGHWLEHGNQQVQAAVFAFYERRTAGEKRMTLNAATKKLDPQAYGGYRSNEYTRLDKFIHAYMGKDYTWGGQRSATEILSMGLQMFYEDPAKLARQDPEYFDFIYAVVRGMEL